jgi:hypothetical protein
MHQVWCRAQLGLFVAMMARDRELVESTRLSLRALAVAVKSPEMSARN